jgi:hypothetical protein
MIQIKDEVESIWSVVVSPAERIKDTKARGIWRLASRLFVDSKIVGTDACYERLALGTLYSALSELPRNPQRARISSRLPFRLPNYYELLIPNEWYVLKFKAAAKLRNITLWRSAEELLIVAAKVCGVFISHTEPGARRV